VFISLVICFTILVMWFTCVYLYSLREKKTIKQLTELKGQFKNYIETNELALKEINKSLKETEDKTNKLYLKGILKNV